MTVSDIAGGADAVLAALVAVVVVVPVLNLVVPAGNTFHVSDYLVQLVAKIMCYAIVALAMDLIWGYTGILSLGHGLFFALGGYAMGMYLMRQIGSDGQLAINQQHFAARYVADSGVVHDPTVRRFYKYEGGTGLWQHQTPELTGRENIYLNGETIRLDAALRMS